MESIKIYNNLFQFIAEKNTMFLGKIALISFIVFVEGLNTPPVSHATSKPVKDRHNGGFLDELMEFTKDPTNDPTSRPTSEPSVIPTARPTSRPTHRPSVRPTSYPAPRIPTQTFEPSMDPTFEPTFSPTFDPTYIPSKRPTRRPTSRPSRNPTRRPSKSPTSEPTFQPTDEPTELPTRKPMIAAVTISKRPTVHPSRRPTRHPTNDPTAHPTAEPSSEPTFATHEPTSEPTHGPTFRPSRIPTTRPSRSPSTRPTQVPSPRPTHHPTCYPTYTPWANPTPNPTTEPTTEPTSEPSHGPTSEPTHDPTLKPTPDPTVNPTPFPTSRPTKRPTPYPTARPTRSPTSRPTGRPTPHPSAHPTKRPTPHPTSTPTSDPSSTPTKDPTPRPTRIPSVHPTFDPNSKICIHLILGDTFGDGWDTANLYIYDNLGNYQIFSPNCTYNPVLGDYCFDPYYATNGDYVSAYVYGYDPKYPWEILWQVLNQYDGSVYTGTYDSKMTFVYKVDVLRDGTYVPTIKLTNSENLISNYISCHSCVEDGQPSERDGYSSDQCPKKESEETSIEEEEEDEDKDQSKSSKKSAVELPNDKMNGGSSSNTNSADFFSTQRTSSSGDIGSQSNSSSYSREDSAAPAIMKQSTSSASSTVSGNRTVQQSSRSKNVRTPTSSRVSGTVVPSKTPTSTTTARTGNKVTQRTSGSGDFISRSSTGGDDTSSKETESSSSDEASSQKSVETKSTSISDWDSGASDRNSSSGGDISMYDLKETITTITTTEVDESESGGASAADSEVDETDIRGDIGNYDHYMYYYYYDYDYYYDEEVDEEVFEPMEDTNSSDYDSTSIVSSYSNTTVDVDTVAGHLHTVEVIKSFDEITPLGNGTSGKSRLQRHHVGSTSHKKHIVHNNLKRLPADLPSATVSGSGDRSDSSQSDSSTINTDGLSKRKRPGTRKPAIGPKGKKKGRTKTSRKKGSASGSSKLGKKGRMSSVSKAAVSKVGERQESKTTETKTVSKVLNRAHGLGLKHAGTKTISKLVSADADRSTTTAKTLPGSGLGGEKSTIIKKTSVTTSEKKGPVATKVTDQRRMQSMSMEEASHNIKHYFLYESDGMEWFSPDRFGTELHVSDGSGDQLFYSGTLCDEDSIEGTCDMTSLPPGEYTWRVTGSLDSDQDNIAFIFCGVRGTYSTEITFSLDCFGDCTPMSVRTLPDVCDAIYSMNYYDNHNDEAWAFQASPLLLQGTVHIGGLLAPTLSATDMSVIRSAVAQELSQASRNRIVREDAVTIESWSLESPLSSTTSHMIQRGLDSAEVIDTTTSNKQLETVMRVTFSAALTLEEFGMDETAGLEHLLELESKMTSFLHRSMRSGVFLSKLVGIATRRNSDNLQYIRYTKLVSISAKRVSRIGEFSWTDVVVLIGLVSGIVFGLMALHVSKYFRIHKKESHPLRYLTHMDNMEHLFTLLPTESTHDRIISQRYTDRRSASTET